MESKKATVEADLAEKAQQGDSAACGELIMQYYPLIKSLAGKYAKYTSRFDVDDLAHQCVATLMHRRMRAFDRNKASFGTWVHLHIRAIMLTTIKETNSEGKAKINAAGVFSQIERDEGCAIAGNIEARQGGSICLTHSIDQMCLRLDHSRASIIKMRSKGMTLKEIGVQLGISKERVRQLEGDAIKELQQVYFGCDSPEDLPDIVEIKPRSVEMPESCNVPSQQATIATMIEKIATDEGLQVLDAEIEKTESTLLRLKTLRKAFGKPRTSNEASEEVRRPGKLDKAIESLIVDYIMANGRAKPWIIAQRLGLTAIRVGRTVSLSEILVKDGAEVSLVKSAPAAKDMTGDLLKEQRA